MISRQSVSESDKLVSPEYRPPLSPGNISVTYFCQRLGRPQTHSATGSITSMENLNDTIGNRTAPFRLVVQCFNQQCHHVPPKKKSA